MAATLTDQELIAAAVRDYYEGIASVTVRSAPYYEYLHLVRTREGWRIANALYEAM
jgi:hypothetical protein